MIPVLIPYLKPKSPHMVRIRLEMHAITGVHKDTLNLQVGGPKCLGRRFRPYKVWMLFKVTSASSTGASITGSLSCPCQRECILFGVYGVSLSVKLAFMEYGWVRIHIKFSLRGCVATPQRCQKSWTGGFQASQLGSPSQKQANAGTTYTPKKYAE